MFDIDAAFIGNNILKKNIKIIEDVAELVVFTQNNNIGQITINSSKNVDVFLDNVLDSLSSNNIRMEKHFLDDENGNILAEIYMHQAESYKIIITKTYLENSKNLSIDYINLNTI